MYATILQDVGEGDRVCQKFGETHQIVIVSRADAEHPTVQTRFGNGSLGTLEGDPYQVVGLTGRPWQEGKTELEMRASVTASVMAYLGQVFEEASLEEIKEAMNRAAEAFAVYLLGVDLYEKEKK